MGKSEYVRSDEVANVRVPLEHLPDLFGVSRPTIERWLRADEIDRHPYTASPFGGGPGKAVRFGDLLDARHRDTGRWVKRHDTDDVS